MLIIGQVILCQIPLLFLAFYLIIEELYNYFQKCRFFGINPYKGLEEKIKSLVWIDTKKIEKRIRKAGSPFNLNATKYIVAKIILPIIMFLLAISRYSDYTYIVLLTVLGFFLPDILLWSKTRDRKNSFKEDFPMVVESIELASTADIPENQVYLLAAENVTSNEMKKELVRLSANYYVTKDREKSLKDFAERLDIPEAKVLQMAICQAEKTGKVKNILENLSDTMFNSNLAILNAKEKSIEYKVLAAIFVIMGSMTSIILQAYFANLSSSLESIF